MACAGAPSTSFVVAISKDVDADLRRHDGEGIDHDSELLAVNMASWPRSSIQVALDEGSGAFGGRVGEDLFGRALFLDAAGVEEDRAR